MIPELTYGRRRRALTSKFLDVIMEFSDEYSHEIPGVIYFPQSLPTNEVEDLYEYNLQGCDCGKNCDESRCICLRRSGTFYRYEDINDLTNYTIQKKGTGPTYECNDNCKCVGTNCGNRLVQFGPRKNLKVQKCENAQKGTGLFTSNMMTEGSFICEYAGEVITEVEAFKRFKNNIQANKMNYIFCIKEHYGKKTTKTYIDPTYYGNIGRYINHSCEPNCKLFIIRVNDTMPILGIFAKRNIPNNIEITYDYGETEPDLENSDNENTRKICCCGSENCRKYLPFDISLA